MTNKEIMKKMDELDKNLAEWRRICEEHPLSESYKETLMQIQQEKAELAEQLYKVVS